MRLVDRVIELKGSLTEDFDYLFLEDGDKEKYGYETDEEVIIDNACPHRLYFINAEYIGSDKCGTDYCKKCWSREYKL